jgi:hypothetical protein
MRDHIIERAWRRLKVLERLCHQLNVGQSQGVDQCPAARDRALSRVDAHQACGGQLQRHRDEVAAVAATELQYAAIPERWRIKSEQRGERGEPVKVRLRERVTRIPNGVIEAGRRRLWKRPGAPTHCA